MTNNRLRYLIIFLGIGLIIFFIAGTIAYLVRRSHHQHRPSQPVSPPYPAQQPQPVPPPQPPQPLQPPQVNNFDACPRPTQYETNYDFDFTTKLHEHQNLNSSIDYFRLSLSWSPTFCQGKEHLPNLFQCQHKFGFVVHGLWPSSNTSNIKSHPRNCRNEPPMSIETIKKYFCMMPSETLMQGEWEKHGTCYWQTPEEYFEQINSLYSKIQLPTNTEDILNNQTIVGREKRRAIKNSFLQLNPQLTPQQIDIKIGKGGKKLREVDFCYDQAFKHIKCF